MTREWDSSRVCELLHEKHRDWDKLFECYVGDASRHADLFDFLRRAFNDEAGLEPHHQEQVRANDRCVGGHEVASERVLTLRSESIAGGVGGVAARRPAGAAERSGTCAARFAPPAEDGRRMRPPPGTARQSPVRFPTGLQ